MKGKEHISEGRATPSPSSFLLPREIEVAMVVTSKWYLLSYCPVCLSLKVWWVWQFRTRCQERGSSTLKVFSQE